MTFSALNVQLVVKSDCWLIFHDFLPSADFSRTL